MMQAELTAWLTAASPLKALVGTRIYWGTAPQGSRLPRLTLNQLYAERSYTFKAPAGLVETRLQFDVWADSFTSMHQVAEALIARVHELPRRQQSVESVFVRQHRSGFVAEPNAAESWHRAIIELEIWHQTGE